MKNDTKNRSLKLKVLAIFLALALLPLTVAIVGFVSVDQVNYFYLSLLAIAAMTIVAVGIIISLWFIRRLDFVESLTTRLADGGSTIGAEERELKELGGLGEKIQQLDMLLNDRRRELADQIRATFDSELAAEKERMEAFLRGIGDGISIVDKEMRIIYVNDVLVKNFGDHTGEFCYQVYEHKNEICGGCPVRKAMDTGEVHHSLRRMYTKDGRLHYYESTGSPIRDEHGEIIAGIELARDVTQRIKLERNVEIRSRELAKANEELRRVNEEIQQAYEELKSTQAQLLQSEKMASLGVLVSGIAHEINNPLNFVSASVQLLDENLSSIMKLMNQYENADFKSEEKERIDKVKEEIEYEYLNEDVKKIVKNIGTGAERMKQIVQNLRTFSRMDSSEKLPVNLEEGIESTLQILYYEYKNRIEIERDYQTVPMVLGSPGQLNQVFMNIIHNAIQAIQGKGKIRICIHPTVDHARISISDTGPGIPADKLSKVFDPFYTTKPVGDGTGLGLSISYGIVKDHNGRLWVESEVGRGTTFHVDLPAQKAELAKGA
ncbi:MAG TPA: ATP-binding protein [bacterium]|nr:ATP-binding protein [bacterium]